MTGIEFDTRFLPLVQVTSHPGHSDAGYVVLFARLDELLKKGDRFVLIAEGKAMSLPSATQRKLIADWLPKVQPTSKRLSLGAALVTPSAAQRGAITALNWLVRPYVPMASFETKSEGLAWCERRLVEVGVPISPALRRLLLQATGS